MKNTYDRHHLDKENYKILLFMDAYIYNNSIRHAKER